MQKDKITSLTCVRFGVFCCSNVEFNEINIELQNRYTTRVEVRLWWPMDRLVKTIHLGGCVDSLFVYDSEDKWAMKGCSSLITLCSVMLPLE